ncbi:hypothetical protein ACWDFL_33790 [Streptomyces bungoensis]
MPAAAEADGRFAGSTYLVDLTKDGRAEVTVGGVGGPGSPIGPVTSGSTAVSGTATGLKRRHADINFGQCLPGARSSYF